LIKPANRCCADAAKCACCKSKSEIIPIGFGLAAPPGAGPGPGPLGPELDDACSSEGRFKTLVVWVCYVCICECADTLVGGGGGGFPDELDGGMGASMSGLESITC